MISFHVTFLNKEIGLEGLALVKLTSDAFIADYTDLQSEG